MSTEHLQSNAPKGADTPTEDETARSAAPKGATKDTGTLRSSAPKGAKDQEGVNTLERPRGGKLATQVDTTDRLLMRLLISEPQLTQVERAGRAGVSIHTVSNRENRELFVNTLAGILDMACTKAAASLPNWLKEACYGGGSTKQLAPRVTAALGLLREQAARRQRQYEREQGIGGPGAPHVAVYLQQVASMAPGDKAALEATGDDAMADLIRQRALATGAPGGQGAAMEQSLHMRPDSQQGTVSQNAGIYDPNVTQASESAPETEAATGGEGAAQGGRSSEGAQRPPPQASARSSRYSFSPSPDGDPPEDAELVSEEGDPGKGTPDN